MLHHYREVINFQISLQRRSLAPSKLGQVKRKYDDEDDDPAWSDKKKGGKNKKTQVVDRATEFLSPYRKPLAQCSLSVVTPNSELPEGTSFHVWQHLNKKMNILHNY